MSICKKCGKGNQNKRTSCWSCGSTELEIKTKYFDRDEVFLKVVKFYMDKGKSREEANETAQRVVQEQEQLWKEKQMINF